jgi:hypothetical protein
MDLGHWTYEKEFDINEWFGFVYRIIDLTTGQHYIGKKQLFGITRKIVKGRKNRKLTKKESNWKTYTSSSTYLNSAIREKGIENFEFFIESLHETKGSLTYAEIEAQIYEDVLRTKLENGTPKYLNKIIAATKFIPAEQTLNESKYDFSRRKMVNQDDNLTKDI